MAIIFDNDDDRETDEKFLFTEKQLREAYNGGLDNCKSDFYETQPFDLEEFIYKIKNPNIEEEEETIPITLGQIKATCGWSRYSDITGANPYMLNEWDPNDREIFDVKISHAKKLNII